MNRSSFHAARNDHDLPGYVSGQDIRGEHDDLGRDILGLRDLA
jgi:hypothetical protein